MQDIKTNVDSKKISKLGKRDGHDRQQRQQRWDTENRAAAEKTKATRTMVIDYEKNVIQDDV